MKNKISFINKIPAFMLLIFLCLSFLTGMTTVYADKRLTLNEAVRISIANSNDLRKVNAELRTSQARLKNALSKYQSRKKEFAAVGFSALFNFSRSNQPILKEMTDVIGDVIKYQSEVNVTVNKITNKRFDIQQKAQGLYISIYSSKAEIDTYKKILEDKKLSLSRAKGRFLKAEITKNDYDALEKKIATYNAKLLKAMADYEANKKKLSTLMRVNITSGYYFTDPYYKMDITRDMLPKIKEYVYDHDRQCAEKAENLALWRQTLSVYQSLMQKKWGGSDMQRLNGYFAKAAKDEPIDVEAFSRDYLETLTRVDRYWKGWTFFILPLKKTVFKKNADGSRFVSGDPNGVIEAFTQHKEAIIENEAAREEAAQNVEDSFNALVSTKKSYLDLIEQEREIRAEFEKGEKLFRIGDISEKELDAMMESYIAVQDSVRDVLSNYSDTSYEFNRLTCGKALEINEEAGFKGFNVGSEIYNLTKNTVKGPSYYIRPILEYQEFELGINVPDDCGITVTDYELFVDGYSIGGKAKKTEMVRHLTMTKKGNDTAKIMLYNGDEIVGSCDIDPDALNGPLEVVTAVKTEKVLAKDLGTYKNQSMMQGVERLTLELTSPAEAVSFRLCTADGSYIGGEDFHAKGDAFKYIPGLKESLKDLKVELYDESGKIICRAHFDVKNHKVIRDD